MKDELPRRSVICTQSIKQRIPFNDFRKSRSGTDSFKAERKNNVFKRCCVLIKMDTGSKSTWWRRTVNPRANKHKQSSSKQPWEKQTHKHKQSQLTGDLELLSLIYRCLFSFLSFFLFFEECWTVCKTQSMLKSVTGHAFQVKMTSSSPTPDIIGWIQWHACRTNWTLQRDRVWAVQSDK